MMRAAVAALAVSLAALLPVQASLAAAPEAAAEGPAPRKAGKASPVTVAPTTAPARYYYEHGQRRALSVDPAWVADFRSPARKTPGQPATPLKRSIGGEKALAALPADASPVFRDEHGAPRALPGGVVVRLRPSDRAFARERLAAAGLVPVRALDAEGHAWLVAASAGTGSLELANQLHESGRYESAAPNWWRPRATK